MRVAVGALLLAVGCASTPPLALPPVVPRAAAEMMCTRMHAEGMTGELRVVKVSQPLITPASLEALAEATFYRGKAAAPTVVAKPVPVETAASCATRAIDALDAARDADVMVLQFSSPFANPFARGKLGVIARLSLGNEAATWYWVPIGERNGIWGAGSPIMLAVRD